MKNFRSSKDSYENEKEGTDWEKIFVKHSSNKEFVTRIYQVYIFKVCMAWILNCSHRSG